MTPTKIGYGIIGFGRHAEKRFIPAFSRSAVSQLIAIQKRDEQALAGARETFGIPSGFTDPARLVQSPDIDAVIVASPPGLHKEHVVAAAAAGKHVLVEKPMAGHARDCQEMIAACRQNRVKLFVGFCMRYLQVIRKTRAILLSGRLGQIRLVEGSFVMDASSSHRTWLSDPALSGGGPVADLGAHLIDLVQYLLAEDITGVKSFLKPPLTARSIERNAAIVLKLANGALASLTTSFELPREKCLIFHGSSAKLTLRNFSEPADTVVIEIESGGHLERIPVTNKHHFVNMIDSFSEAIINDAPVEIPGEDGLSNQKIIDQIYRQGGEQ